MIINAYEMDGSKSLSSLEISTASAKLEFTQYFRPVMTFWADQLLSEISCLINFFFIRKSVILCCSFGFTSCLYNSWYPAKQIFRSRWNFRARSWIKKWFSWLAPSLRFSEIKRQLIDEFRPHPFYRYYGHMLLVQSNHPI